MPLKKKNKHSTLMNSFFFFFLKLLTPVEDDFQHLETAIAIIIYLPLRKYFPPPPIHHSAPLLEIIDLKQKNILKPIIPNSYCV